MQICARSRIFYSLSVIPEKRGMWGGKFRRILSSPLVGWLVEGRCGEGRRRRRCIRNMRTCTKKKVRYASFTRVSLCRWTQIQPSPAPAPAPFKISCFSCERGTRVRRCVFLDTSLLDTVFFCRFPLHQPWSFVIRPARMPRVRLTNVCGDDLFSCCTAATCFWNPLTSLGVRLARRSLGSGSSGWAAEQAF